MKDEYVVSIRTGEDRKNPDYVATVVLKKVEKKKTITWYKHVGENTAVFVAGLSLKSPEDQLNRRYGQKRARDRIKGYVRYRNHYLGSLDPYTNITHKQHSPFIPLPVDESMKEYALGWFKLAIEKAISNIERESKGDSYAVIYPLIQQ